MLGGVDLDELTVSRIVAIGLVVGMSEFCLG